MTDTEIAWCHATINFWMGCNKVSHECNGCYVEAMMTRVKGDDFKQLRLTRGPWLEAEVLNARAQSKGTHLLVFTCSMSDFFHRDADPWRDEAWDVIRRCRNLIWLILTKRPERILENLPADWEEGKGYPHVWLGVTCGQPASFKRIETLRQIPCSLRFLSCEPLIEDIGDINLEGIGWVLCGGMSGDESKNLGMNIRWAAGLYEAAKKAGVPYLFKQISAHKPDRGINALGLYLAECKGEECDPATVDCVREFPESDLSFIAPREKGERFTAEGWAKYGREQAKLVKALAGRILPEFEPPPPQDE